MAVLVTPAAPFLEWLRAVDPIIPEHSLPEIREDSTIYLIPEFVGFQQADDYLATMSSAGFEQELDQWYRVPELWPAKRDVTELRRWFDISFHSMLVDQSARPLKREDLSIPLL